MKAEPRVGVMGTRLALFGARSLHLYFHPREEMSLRQFDALPAFTRRTGEVFLNALDRLLTRNSGRLEPRTVREVVEKPTLQ